MGYTVKYSDMSSLKIRVLIDLCRVPIDSWPLENQCMTSVAAAVPVQFCPN